jgi:tRNA threonylcarbamoyladenosine biosynthesis protein TsaE
MRQWVIETASPAETRALGVRLGRLLAPSAVLLLTGDLGAGKTCFVQGLARGLEVPEDEPVTSPSYTLLNIHEGRLPLYHFDLYRLSRGDDLLDLGFDEYLQGGGVTVIEWADRIPAMGVTGLRLHLRDGGDGCRQLLFAADAEPYLSVLGNLEQAWRDKERAP